jgi:DNA ligase (NAD+)
MDAEDARREIARLREDIARHDRLYYQEAAPEISDGEYDALQRRLSQLEREHPELARPDSPSRRVGSDRDQRFPSAPHSVPMLSLQNSYDLDDVAAFDQRLRKDLQLEHIVYTVEPKIDGVALALRYVNGELVMGLTRGDGLAGDVITENVRTIPTVPERLSRRWAELFPEAARLEVRGEVFMTLSRFAALNSDRQAAGLAPFANPRNATAGTLKTLDPSGCWGMLGTSCPAIARRSRSCRISACRSTSFCAPPRT